MTNNIKSTLITIFAMLLLIMALLSIIAGIYMTFGWALYGGIVTLVKIFSSTLPIDVTYVILNVLRVLFCVEIGMITSFICSIITALITIVPIMFIE